jgi:ubiquinone/menaquinone biosynthesis C-methylase UbiE
VRHNTASDTADLTHATEAWYDRYVSTKGADRNDILRNRDVLFQYMAYESSLIKAVRQTCIESPAATVLDVGCGSGNSLVVFLTLGLMPSQLHGIDIQPARVQIAKARLPGATIACGDATQIAFPDGAFNIVTESTMFMQITDESLAAKISGEMLRVTKSGGFILLADWRYADPRRSEYRALTTRRLRSLFGVGTHTRICATIPGSLIPPIGRVLSRRYGSLYFLAAALCPPLVGQVTTVLQKLQ